MVRSRPTRRREHFVVDRPADSERRRHRSLHAAVTVAPSSRPTVERDRIDPERTRHASAERGFGFQPSCPPNRPPDPARDAPREGPRTCARPVGAASTRPRSGARRQADARRPRRVDHVEPDVLRGAEHSPGSTTIMRSQREPPETQGSREGREALQPFHVSRPRRDGRPRRAAPLAARARSLIANDERAPGGADVRDGAGGPKRA